MLLNLFLFILGIALILYGADILTSGAAAISRRFGLSPIVVGLTIVAFGTSAPELVVSINSALSGNSDISLGNVIGSNIFNILAIAGLTAIVAPLAITRETISREIPLMLLVSVVLCLVTFDTFFSGLNGQTDVIGRSEGLLLLAFLVIFIAYTIAISRNSTAETIEPVQKELNESPKSNKQAKKPLLYLLMMVLGGLLGLVFGGDLFVKSASEIAEALGVRQSIIALTIVAAGTSLPELATTVVAALKGEQDMAVANVVGSNILNICLVLGLTATIQPIRLGGLSVIDFSVMLVASAMLYVFALFYGKRVITRLEGCILFSAYIAYTAYLINQVI